MIEDVRLCIEPTCARRAAGALLLCWGGRDRLARLLDPANTGGVDPDHPDRGEQPGGLAALYRDAADISHRTGTEAGHEHADFARVDDRAISTRDARTTWDGPGAPRSVVATLGGWARIVHEERGDPLPRLARRAWAAARVGLAGPGHGAGQDRWLARPGDVVSHRRPVPTTEPDVLPAWVWVPVQLGRSRPRPDVEAVDALSRWLHARVDWICTRPWVDELLADLRDVAAQLRRGDARGRYLGPCSVPVNPDTGQPDPFAKAIGTATLCGGPLSVPSGGHRDPLAAIQLPSVRCPHCGSKWEGAELLLWARERGLIGVEQLLDRGPTCPVHDLPSDRPVRIRINGTLHDGPAGEVCREWHTEHELRAGTA